MNQPQPELADTNPPRQLGRQTKDGNSFEVSGMIHVIVRGTGTRKVVFDKQIHYLSDSGEAFLSSRPATTRLGLQPPLDERLADAFSLTQPSNTELSPSFFATGTATTAASK